MDAVDSQPHPETLKGKAEVERGMAKLTGGRGVSADQSERAYPQAARGDPGHGVGPNYSANTGYGADSGYGAATCSPVEARGDTLGPTSTMNAGFGNAGLEAEAAFAPGQIQQGDAAGYTAREPGRTTDRDFANAGQNANVTGPAPDRYGLSGEPRQLG